MDRWGVNETYNALSKKLVEIKVVLSKEFDATCLKEKDDDETTNFEEKKYLKL